MYLWMVQQVMFTIAHALAWFDRHVVDGAVNGLAWLCRATGQGLSRLQWGRLQACLIAFVAGLVIIMVALFAVNASVFAWVK